MAVSVGNKMNGQRSKSIGETALIVKLPNGKYHVESFEWDGENIGDREFSSEDSARSWVKQNAPGASIRVQSKSFTSFCKAVAHRETDLLRDEYGSRWENYPAVSVQKSAMGETSGMIGGYLLPTEYSVQLLETLAEESWIYPRANVMPMGTAQTLCPVFDSTTVQAAAVSPFFSGVTFTWGFSQAPTQTAEPTFKMVGLTAWDLLGFGVMSNQWLTDTGPAGEQKLVQMLGRAAAWSAEYAFLNGLGAGGLMPLGILKSGALISKSRAGGNHVAAADLSLMASALLPRSWTRAVWACNPTVLSDLMRLTGWFLNATGMEGDGRHFTLHGRPGYVTELLPALGTAGDIVLFDPSLYAVGNRQEVLVDISDQVPNYFEKNQSVFRVWMRMAGMPQLNSTVTLQDHTTVVSAYVTLAA